MAEIAREDKQDDKRNLDAQWQKQQIKSFTAWVNSHLLKVGDKVESLSEDFKDGRRLIKLVEIMCGRNLRRPEKGRMRVHSIQNINIALEGISSTGVKLVGISAEEIADGNDKLILGMIWIMILRFQIQDISVEEMSAKEGLLLWCQRKTHGYKGVAVNNFHMSFQDGNAFAALIHKHRPDLIDYDQLAKQDPKTRLNTVFKIAEDHLAIPQMLDADDMLETSRPDERSVMTYVAAYYHAFAGMGKTETSARRLSTVLGLNKEFFDMITEYTTRASELLAWIAEQRVWLDNHATVSSLDECTSLFAAVRSYTKSDKPPKSKAKSSLEAHYSTLQTKLRLNNRPAFHPEEGLLVSNIDAAWSSLAASERAREKFLRSEEERLAKLEMFAKRFKAKANIHNKWANAKIPQSESTEYGHDLPSVTSLVRQHKAFQGDVNSHQKRPVELRTLVETLRNLKYSNIDEIEQFCSKIETDWVELNNRVSERATKLQENKERLEKLDELCLEFAGKVADFTTWYEVTEEEVAEEINVTTLEGLETAKAAFDEFKGTLDDVKKSFEQLIESSNDLASQGITENIYTDFTAASLTEMWNDSLALVAEKEKLFENESIKQNEREQKRILFAEKANAFGSAINELTLSLRDGSYEGALEDQITAHNTFTEKVSELKVQQDAVHECSVVLDEAKITDNPHSTHTVEELDAMYDNLKNTCSKTLNTLENQVLMRDQSGISEEQMKEYRDTFKAVDRTHAGTLGRLEFRACLLASGFELPELKGEEGSDPAMDLVMSAVDPENTGRVTFEAFVDYVSKDKQDTGSAEQFRNSFRQISGDKDYVTEDIIRRELSPSTADYVMKNIKPYPGVEGGLDYNALTDEIFN